MVLLGDVFLQIERFGVFFGGAAHLGQVGPHVEVQGGAGVHVA